MSVEITTNGIDFLPTMLHYFYVDDMGVTSIYPDTGPISGGTAITLFGSNFEKLDSAALKS